MDAAERHGKAAQPFKAESSFVLTTPLLLLTAGVPSVMAQV